jgi:hypothetical protein
MWVCLLCVLFTTILFVAVVGCFLFLVPEMRDQYFPGAIDGVKYPLRRRIFVCCLCERLVSRLQASSAEPFAKGGYCCGHCHMLVEDWKETLAAEARARQRWLDSVTTQMGRIFFRALRKKPKMYTNDRNPAQDFHTQLSRGQKRRLPPPVAAALTRHDVEDDSFLDYYEDHVEHDDGV